MIELQIFANHCSPPGLKELLQRPFIRRFHSIIADETFIKAVNDFSARSLTFERFKPLPVRLAKFLLHITQTDPHLLPGPPPFPSCAQQTVLLLVEDNRDCSIVLVSEDAHVSLLCRDGIGLAMWEGPAPVWWFGTGQYSGTADH